MSLELKEQYEKIYAFCYFKVQNREIAEDITQETFLKYFDGAQYLERGKKLAFLYTIARNCCNDHFRRSRQTVDIDNISEVVDKNIDILSSEEIADSLETTLVVHAAVSKLSVESQEIVLLRFANGLGIGEIAEYLGISRFAVYRKLNAIIKQLNTTLRKEDFYG